ncbi:MAG TPA: 3'-5' exonuclease, partial [Noviherbaspirillum sp.]|nr:3'-5' exonuclease [Noviherbaspirillum sp.]
VGASDDDLIALAGRGERNWWLRLLAAGETASPALARAARLLAQWLEAAPRLPVHDLLDMVMHEGDLVARYAAAAHPARRAQVLGNLEAFMELALELDSGRYPSLPRFIEQLRLLRNGTENAAPDEASIDAAADAVRILTIHSAKGLEAPIVALLDANHSDPAREDCGILCDWPQDADGPTHFSCFGRTSERGAARDALFAAEEGYAAQEDWNLLYVAITRARDVLLLTGVANAKSDDGTKDNSWYARMAGVPVLDPETLPEPVLAAAQTGEAFSLMLFDPAPLPAPAAVVPTQVSSAAIEEGVALHALLERLTQDGTWPPAVPSVAEIGRWIGCGRELAQKVRAQAECILGAPALERFFNPAHFTRAHNELEVVVDGMLLRMDRLVVSDDALWVLDYKRDVLDSERSAYAQQVERYLRALAPIFPGMRMYGGLIRSDGVLIEL